MRKYFTTPDRKGVITIDNYDLTEEQKEKLTNAGFIEITIQEARQISEYRRDEERRIRMQKRTGE